MTHVSYLDSVWWQSSGLSLSSSSPQAQHNRGLFLAGQDGYEGHDLSENHATPHSGWRLNHVDKWDGQKPQRLPPGPRGQNMSLAQFGLSMSICKMETTELTHDISGKIKCGHTWNAWPGEDL